MQVSSVIIDVDPNAATMLYVGDSIDLIAGVYPPDAHERSLTWSSSDTSVATVTSLGNVEAVGAGQAQIKAFAGGYSDTYNLVVSERESALPSPTPAPSDAQPASSYEVREVTVIDFDTATLPDGTRYILLPCGEMLELNGEDIVRIKVPCEDVDGDGNIEFIALNDERVPLGSVYIDTVNGTNPKQNGVGTWTVILMVLSSVLIGAAAALFIVRIIIQKNR